MSGLRQSRRQFLRSASLVVLASLVTKVRAASPEPTPVFIDKDAIVVLGLRVTAAELFKVLTEQHVKAIVLHTKSSEDYETIGKVIYGAGRAGIELKIAAKP